MPPLNFFADRDAETHPKTHPKDTTRRKDAFYTYYHCLRRTRFDLSYKCKQYDDPLAIPYPDETFESFVIPVRHWIPEFYHPTYIQNSIRDYREKFMQVDIESNR